MKKNDTENEKRRQWLEIQGKVPDLAAFMAALSARFGKVRLVSVVLHVDKSNGG